MPVGTPALLLLDRLGDAGVEALLHQAEHPAGEQGPYLCCRACARRITAASARVAKAGKHQHRCTNPQGYTFAIGCFAQAAGCQCQGPAVHEHTWFAGYAWRIALCGGCGAHLGWRYEGGETPFFGLIFDQLVECREDRPH